MFATLNKAGKNLLTLVFISILLVSSMVSINRVSAIGILQTNSIDANSTNLTNSIDANSTNLPIPKPITSFQFGWSKDAATAYDTTNLRNLTVSAWIKPDYSQGASVLTVVSKDNAFTLAVNDNMPPAKMAIFSVFDGIKWTTVQSYSIIPERWTHLTATFNGTSIKLYVNSNLEGTTPILGIPTITASGYLETKTVQNLTSNSAAVIGGYHDSVSSQTSHLFSGEISNVSLYDSLLTQTQINQIYTSTKPLFAALDIMSNTPAQMNQTYHNTKYTPNNETWTWSTVEQSNIH
ncbi:MAG: LamG domain-containing protein [Nitrosotalea sp.]